MSRRNSNDVRHVRVRSWVAGTLAFALGAGALVAGVGVQVASAAAFTPEVSISGSGSAGKDFILAGEDAKFDVAIANPDGGKQYNLAITALLPAAVNLVDGGAFGTPTTYTAGMVLPNTSRTSPATDCATLGLVPAPGQPTKCAVPAGMQYWVWTNLSDLPQGATVDSTITVRPNATVYPVGSSIGFNVAAFTSNAPTKLPVFDGSTSVAKTTAHNSGRGTGTDTTPVQALRVTKSEPSAEEELLRGIHQNVTNYTLRLENTGQAATDTVTVTDYLPAGLEYLGVSGGDNSAAGIEEYPGSGRIPGAWAPTGEQVETVQLSGSEATALGLAGAGVYTKVTWTIPSLAGGVPQTFPGTPGAPRVLTFGYQAAVPLFENELWPAGAAPTPASGAQGANLDNNTGPSTRHGSADVANPAQAQVLKNVVVATGTYSGQVVGDDAALRAQTDRDSETIDAVDLRVLKSVQTDKGDAFATDKLAHYTLDVATSEYVDSTGITLTDTIPNGLCTAFPEQAVAPKLFIMNGGDTEELDQVDWNNTITPGSQCNYPSTETGATLTGATVNSITFNADTGEFTVVFAMADLAANGRVLVDYTLMQRPDYTGGNGATSSGDRMTNHVKIAGTTTPIAAIANDPTLAAKVGAERYPLDDSQATIGSHFTKVEKTVLERGKTLANAAPADWVDAATAPFSPGDRVWYRIVVPFAEGIDTRNPILEDFLPEGIEYVGAKYGWTGIPGIADQLTPVDISAGAGFPNAYVRTPTLVSGPDSMTWNLGASNRARSTDRFMPLDSTLSVYVEARVTGQSNSSGDIDSPFNHAKYQQVNVEGEVSFERADAKIDLDWGATLKKGIRTNPHADGSTNAPFNNGGTNEVVVQGDQVVYRLDVTASQNVSGKYVIWDVLPQGVKAADVGTFTAALVDGGAESALTTGQFTAAAYDTVPAGGPALAPQYAGRSVIIWTLNDAVSVPGSTADTVRGLTVGYTLTVPAGGGAGGTAAELTQSYVNTAGIVSYAFANNVTSGSTTVVPQETGDGAVKPLTDRTPASGEVGIGNQHTIATAEVHLPNVTPTKKLVSTEVGPLTAAAGTVGLNDTGDANSTQARIVQGEYATFEYAITIPAHTTVQGAALYDNGAFAKSGGPLRYEFVPNSAKFFGPNNATATPDTCGSGDLAGFGCLQSNGPAGSEQRGVLRFPSSYTNATNQGQTFRAQVTVWVKDRDANPGNSAVTQIANNTTLTNTATFGFDDPNTTGQRISRTATAQAQFVEPEPTIAKVASSGQVDANGGVSYTVTASNTAGRPALYDVTVYDCVPSEIAVTASSLQLTPATGSGTVEVVTGQKCEIVDGKIVRGAASASKTGTLIKWTIPQLNGGAAPKLTYSGTVTSIAGGGATFTNYAELTGHTLPTELGADDDTTDRRGMYTAKTSAVVELSDAELVKTVTPSSAPVGETVTYTLTTTLPAHVNFYDVTLSDTLPAGMQYVPAGAHTETVDWAGAEDAPTVSAPSISGQTMRWAIDANDILLHDQARTITVTFKAKITDATTGAALRNVGTFGWNMVDGDNTTGTSTTGDASVTLLNPVLAIVKKVDGLDAVQKNPQDGFDYTVKVTNTGNTPAYNVTVTDTVPVGVIVTPGTIVNGGVLTGAGANGGGTITWTLAGPLHQQSGTGSPKSLDLSYEATFADSETLTASALTNTAQVTHFESFGTGGRVYTPTGISDTAQVTPLFPKVDLTKTVSDGSLAYVDESFGWTLKLVNSGQGAAQTLVVTDVLPTNWVFDADSARVSVGGAAAVPLVNPVVGDEGGNATLTWNLGSASSAASPSAPILPGIASGATLSQRTVKITFIATPLVGAATTAGTGINVHPHTNTLRAVTTDGTGSTNNATASFTGDDSTANAFLGEADLTIAKTGAADPLVAGETATGWSILVTNDGPDTAAGPITVTDTTAALPAGITVTGAAGDGWTCELPERAAGGVTTFDCARTDATESLASGDSFPAIEVEVEVADNQAAVTGIMNSATVNPGRTVDPDPDNNTDEDPISTTISADLALEKTVTTQDPTAGSAITWLLAPTNLGPSVSVHTDAAPITITDTIPAGISGVADPSTADWAATTTAAGGFPVGAGDVVTWTYTGTQLAVGAAPTVTLSGTIDAGWTGGAIANTGVITPGGTPDPDPDNNTDEVTVTPGDSTTLAINKTRVVFQGGAWVAAASLDPVPVFEPGTDVSYRITVVNNGPADARAVKVVDEVPAGLTYKTHANGTGTWTRTAGPDEGETFSLTGTQQMGAAHATSFVVTFATDPAMDPAVALVNWAEDSAENSTNTPRDDDSTIATRDADLSIEKSHTAPAAGVAAVAGESVSYQLVVTNHGPSISDAPITVADTLPAGFSYAAGSAQVSVAGGAAAAANPTVLGQTLTWTNLTADVALAANETIVITFTTDIAATVGAQTGVLNTATVSGPNDTDPGNNTDTDPVDIVTQADMVITKDVAVGPWVAGTDVSYTITVQNDGPSVADATVTDLLPAGVSFVSISGSTGWACTDATVAAPASCAYPAHPVGAASASTITVVGHIASNVATGTELTNVAELEWVDSRDVHEGSDDADITVTTLADLVLVKSAIDAEGDETSAAVAGEQSRYRLSVTNDGPSDAVAPLTVTDTLPAGISFVGLTSGSSASWSAVADVVDEVTGTQRVVFTRIPAGTGIADGVTAPAIDFDVLVDQAVADGSVLTNTATVTSDTPEADVTNNTDMADLTVGREVDVSIVKSHDAEAVSIGDALPFTLQVTNGGPSVASGVMVTDVVPFGLEVLSVPGDGVGEGWTLVSVDPVDPDDAAAGTRVVASYGETLVAGEAAPALTLTTTVLTEAYATVINTADVTVAEQDRDPANNHAEDPVTVPPLATLVVEKTAVGTFQVGKTSAYRITVSNSGPTEDPGPITVTDVLPNGLTFASSPDAGVTVSGKTVTWTIDGLAVGESVDLTLIVNVQQAAFPSVTNVVEVASPTELTPESVTVDDATVTVAAADPMPATGSDQLLVLGGIALLLLLGGGALLMARRRRALSE